MKTITLTVMTLLIISNLHADDEWLTPWLNATIMIVGGESPDLLGASDTLTISGRANATGFLVQSEVNGYLLPPLVITCGHVIDSLSQSCEALHILFYSSEDEVFIEMAGCIQT